MAADTPEFFSYLHFDGSSYIVTDIIPPADCSFRVRVREAMKSSQMYFECNGANSALFGIELNNDTNTSMRAFTAFYGRSSTVVSGTTKTLTWSGVPTYQLWLTCKRLGTGSTSVTFTKGNEIPSGGIVIGQSAGLNGVPYKGSMQQFRIYGDETQNVTTATDFSSYTPVITLRPCVFRGEAGMWYVEGNKFYGNAGVGILTANNIDS